MNNKEKLSKLRELMVLNKIDTYIVPTNDPHMSEFVSSYNERRKWISEFTGSAGTALVTLTKALLWTDGRYFLQAKQELSDDWILMKMDESITISKWLQENKCVVGINPLLFSVEEIDDLGLGEHVVLVDDLIDLIWIRPTPLNNLVRIHDIKYAGMDVASKVVKVREFLKENKMSFLAVTALDEIAWLLNIRGTDISYTPIVTAYVIVGMYDIMLYIDEKKLDDTVINYLKENDITTKPYDDIFKNDISSPNIVLIDPSTCNYKLYLSFKNKKKEISPIKMEKACKNKTEIDGMIECHKNDAIAVIKYLCWLDKQLDENNYVDEMMGAIKLEEFRKQQQLFMELSFPTISAVGPNGAIIHYQPKKDSCRQIKTNELYLVDSGGQYLNGTTDITRTVHFGIPTKYEKECFTRVLKGHINLARAQFPDKITLKQLDVLARQSLWEIELDYYHGTSHGVGSYLNVHEDPPTKTSPIKPGMILSNEPGYYEENQFGIRIESLMVVRNAPNKFLNFETITYVPIQAKMINFDIMNDDEKMWLQNYNSMCFKKLKSYLNTDELKAWLFDHAYNRH